MAPNVTEAIFTSKSRIYDLYPNLSEAKMFDLEREHLFYGRIDKNCNSVYLKDSKLKQLQGPGHTNFAVNFVADAFQDLKFSLKRLSSAGYYNSGVFPRDIGVHRAWTNGNPMKLYEAHVNKLYDNFMNEYLVEGHRRDSITGYREFIKLFLDYCLTTCQQFPLTKTGFMSSIHCSPFSSGLMVEYAAETHGIAHNARVIRYVNDPYFAFFVKHVKKYGFMVDKNAPWRLIFNIASGKPASEGDPTGAQRYMSKYNVTYDDVFEKYYQNALSGELENIKKVLFILYDSFYRQFPTREVIEQYKNTSSRCQGNKNVSRRLPRQPPPEFADVTSEDLYFNGNSDEYWYKILLKLRFVEARKNHDIQNFYFFSKKLIDNLRTLGHEAAEKFISDLTKGFAGTTFNVKGKYWHGQPDDIYRKTAIQAKLKGENPTLTSYSLTGTKNTK
jgi:hypothetical protein